MHVTMQTFTVYRGPSGKFDACVSFSFGDLTFESHISNAGFFVCIQHKLALCL